MQCKSGEIVRAGYWRSNRKSDTRTWVKPSCIRNLGAPGKGIVPTVSSLQRGRLAAIGYNVAQPASYRRAAIARGVARYGRAMMQWRLEWEGTWRNAKLLAQSKPLLADAQWLKKQGALKAEPLRCPSPEFQLRKPYTYVRNGKRIRVSPTCVSRQSK